MTTQALCKLCGEPMPAGEEMFTYHGYSGPCPKPSLLRAEPVAAPPVVPTMGRRLPVNEKALGEAYKVFADGMGTLKDSIIAYLVAAPAPLPPSEMPEYPWPQGSLEDDVLTVCEAFDAGLFVRSVKGDLDDDWQMKFIGPLGALGRLSRYVRRVDVTP